MILELYLAGVIFTAGHFTTRFYFEAQGQKVPFGIVGVLGLWPVVWPLYWIGFLLFDILDVEAP